MVVVDARGLRCPLPLRLVLREVERQGEAAVFEVLADDPAFDLDLRAWAVGVGFHIDRLDPMGGHYRVTRVSAV